MIKKNLKICILLIIILFSYNNIVYANTLPDISSDSAIVIEQKTGRILYSKNIDEKRPMASTTKIMTAIVAIENGDMGDVVKISKKASGIGGSSIWLEENEKLTLEELLYGLMLRSGNDAAYAIGEHIGNGEIQNFIDMMNKKAKELNALNTSFANPHGLDHDEHYTTAHDLAKISAFGMGNDLFKTIVSTKKKTISWSSSEWNRSLNNKNKMLWNYEGGNGIKTGYTSKAGKCLVSSAIQNDMQLISVVLHSNDIWSDSKTILDYVFNTYRPFSIVKKDEYIKSIQVINGTKEIISTYSVDNIVIPLSEGEEGSVKVQLSIPDNIEAPIQKEQLIGNLDVFVGDEKIDSTEIYVKESIAERAPNTMLKKFIRYWMDI
jgi:D-alanyl-D-alanine carboxypeptidase (penicillin-binding protein 5/6)